MAEDEQRGSVQGAPDIGGRSHDFALRIVRLCRVLSEDRIGTVLVHQLLRSGATIGANVEEGQAAQSKRDFAHKISTARKEAFETRSWLRIVRDSGCIVGARMEDIIGEADGIRRIPSSIVLTAREGKAVNS